VLDEGGDVGAEEVLALAETDHERRVATRTDDETGVVLVHREERVGPLEARDDRTEGLHEVLRPCVLAADHDRRDLGVGLAAEGEAVTHELALELGEVLDDPVVDDGELVVVGQVGVGVGVGGATVRGPAGVADARGAVGHGRGLEVVTQDGELARALAHVELAVAVDHGDAGGVVPPVLQTRQTRQKDVLALPRTHVTDDSAHGVESTWRG
jgi:hypothetical protein